MSILPFVNSHILKEDLNRIWKKKHTYVDKNITLSKLRRIKYDLLNTFCKDANSNVREGNEEERFEVT
jgi:hypothetical protein